MKTTSSLVRGDISDISSAMARACLLALLATACGGGAFSDASDDASPPGDAGPGLETGGAPTAGSAGAETGGTAPGGRQAAGGAGSGGGPVVAGGSAGRGAGGAGTGGLAAGGAATGGAGAGGAGGAWVPILPGDLPPLPTDPPGYCRNPYITNGEPGRVTCGNMAAQGVGTDFTNIVYRCESNSHWVELERCVGGCDDSQGGNVALCVGDCNPYVDELYCTGTTAMVCVTTGTIPNWTAFSNHFSCTG